MMLALLNEKKNVQNSSYNSREVQVPKFFFMFFAFSLKLLRCPKFDLLLKFCSFLRSVYYEEAIPPFYFLGFPAKKKTYLLLSYDWVLLLLN